jgi:hypothetical protein
MQRGGRKQPVPLLGFAEDSSHVKLVAVKKFHIAKALDTGKDGKDDNDKRYNIF